MCPFSFWISLKLSLSVEEFNFSDYMNLSQDESNYEEFSPRQSKRHILETAHFLIQFNSVCYWKSADGESGCLNRLKLVEELSIYHPGG